MLSFIMKVMSAQKFLCLHLQKKKYVFTFQRSKKLCFADTQNALLYSENLITVPTNVESWHFFKLPEDLHTRIFLSKMCYQWHVYSFLWLAFLFFLQSTVLSNVSSRKQLAKNYVHAEFAREIKPNVVMSNLFTSFSS